jgi:hypothetical protein
MAETLGRLGALYLSPVGWTPQALSAEAMQEVDLTAEGRPLHTVYEIINPLHRYLDDDTVPVFKADVAGGGSFSTITPYKVEYIGCRIYLTTPRGADDVVECYSGNYVPIAFIAGVTDYDLQLAWDKVQKMYLRDTSKRNILLQKNWSSTINLSITRDSAAYTTALTGSDNNITWTHFIGGTAGNAVTVTYADPGAPTQSLSITLSGSAITVHLATNGSSVITTKASDIVDLAGKNALLRELGVSANIKTSETGQGVVTAMTAKTLSGGADPKDYAAVSGKCVAVFYSDLDTDSRWEDFAIATKDVTKINSGGVNEMTITLEQYGGPRAGPFLRKS